MSDITYSDKVNTGSGTTRKWRYLDANEVKTAVNSKADKRPVSTTLSGTTWDGSPVRKTLSSNTDITFSSTKREGFMIVKQDGTGGRTFAINGTSVPINTGANAKTVISFILDESASEYVFTYETNVIGVTGGDTTPPTVTSVTIQNATPTKWDILWNEPLDTSGSTAGTGDFNVTIDAVAGTVTGVNESGSTTQLTVTPAVTGGQTCLVSFAGGSNKIQDVAGNDAAAFTNHSVVNNVGGLDADATTYITAEETLSGSSMSSGNKTAVSNLVVALKAVGSGAGWTNLVGGYPMLLTGTLNLKDPGNADANHRLKQGVGSAATFGSGGWTFDGVDDFLNANLTPSIDLALYQEHYSFAFTGFTEDNAIFGLASSGTSSIFCGAVTPTSGEHVIQGGTLSLSAFDTSSGRYYFGKRDDGGGNTNTRVLKNGTQLATSTNAAAGTAVAHEVYLGAYNNNNGSNGGAVLQSATTIKCMFIFKGNFTNAQEDAIDTAVAAYLTAIGR